MGILLLLLLPMMARAQSLTAVWISAWSFCTGSVARRRGLSTAHAYPTFPTSRARITCFRTGSRRCIDRRQDAGRAEHGRQVRGWGEAVVEGDTEDINAAAGAGQCVADRYGGVCAAIAHSGDLDFSWLRTRQWLFM